MTRCDLGGANVALNPAHCYFDDWFQHVPEHEKAFQLPVWLKRAKRNPPAWAQFSKAGSERAPAIWKRQEISNWFYDLWSVEFPSAYQSLIESGFPPAEAAEAERLQALRRRRAKRAVPPKPITLRRGENQV